MTSSRWFLSAVAGILFVCAAGTAMKVASSKVEDARRTGDLLRRYEHDAGKSSRGSRRASETHALFRSLPAHLKDLVLKLDERAQVLMEGEEISVGQELEAQEELKPLLEGVVIEDLKILIDYYLHSDSEIGLDGLELVDNLLFERWGRLDPEGAHGFIRKDIQLGVSQLTEPINFYDPFGPDFGMDMRYDQIVSLFRGWGVSDPMVALAAWEESHATLENHPMISDAEFIHNQVLEGISSGWSSSAPRQAWDYLRENFSELPEGWRRGFFEGLGESAPWQQVANDIHSSSDPGLLAHAPRISAEWARHEPERALAWQLETNPEEVGWMFDRWHEFDYHGQAFDWLRENRGQLSEEVRLAAVRAALESQWGPERNVMPLVAELPRNDATWELVITLATGGADPFSQMDPEWVRTVVETLQPPEDIRKQVEIELTGRPES